MNKKTWITAYDIFSARIAETVGIDTILIGDSLGMTVYGDEDTKSMTPEIMARHFIAVKRGAPLTPLVLDFPFNCESSLEKAVETAEYFSSLGAKCFKIEGDATPTILSIFQNLQKKGFEIVAHLGLQPQKFLKKDWKVQGKTEVSEKNILNSIQKFEEIGIKTIVLECVPESLGKKAQKIFSGEIIGIGAGRFCKGQVLVFDDVVGKTPSSFSPRFVQTFGNAEIYEKNAVLQFKNAVLNKQFPSKKNCF